MTLSKLKQLAFKATPGPWESRCREFSNHALPIVWTEFGWLDSLPREYRVPSVEFIAAANPAAVLALIERIEQLEYAAQRVVKDAGDVLDAESKHNTVENIRAGNKPGYTLISGRFEVNAAMYALSYSAETLKQLLLADDALDSNTPKENI